MSSPNPADDEREHFFALLKRFRTAMLITVGEGRELHARPMAIAQVEDDGRVWFVTDRDTLKVYEIERDARVHLTAQEGDSAFLSLCGHAAIVEDRQKVEELWREPFRVWFPGGKDDPDLQLIAVHPDRGEYWDSAGGNRVKYLWAAAKAYVTGTKPKVEEGELHGKARL